MTVEDPRRIDEGIPLSHVWQAIVRYRAMVAATLIASLLAGVALIYVLPTKYEAMARIRIGQVSGLGLFEETGSLSTRILAEYGLESGRRDSREDPYVRTVQLRRGTNNVIEIVAIGHSAESARQLLEKINTHVSEEHNAAYEAGLGVLKASLSTLDKNRDALISSYDELDTLVKRARSANTGELGFLIMQQGQVNQALATLEERRPQLVTNMLPPRTQVTTLLGDITAGDTPASPKKLVILSAMAFLGLMTGIAIAVFRASISVVKQRQP